MIEPAQQNRVRIDQRFGAKVRGTNPIPPRNVYPGPGKQVLMFARKIAARGFTQSEKTVDAAAKKHVIPSGDVQRGNADLVEALAGIERGPIFAGRIVIEPVEHVRREIFAVQSRMRANG